jgi:hypothetical protein
LIEENNHVTNKELAIHVGIAGSAIVRHLAILVDGGYIIRHGKTKGAYWIVLKEYK